MGIRFFFRKKRKPASERKDRRKDPRVPEDNEMLVELLSELDIEGKNKIFSVLSKDTSVGGLKLQADTLFPVGSVVKIKFISPKTGKEIQATGKIVWAKDTQTDEVFEMGLKFLNTPSDTMVDLLEHIYKKM